MKQELIKDIMNADRDELRKQPLSRQESEDMIILWDRFIGSFVTQGFDLSDLPLSSLEIMKEIGDIIDRKIKMIHQDIPMIKELRRRLGFTEQDLGNFLGIGRETVSRWENGSIILSDERRKQIKTLLDQYQNHRGRDSLFVSFDTLTIYDNINKETKQ